MKRALTMTVAAVAAASVNAKTLALWPMELDPDSGTFDVSATGFSGALDMWRISSGILSKDEFLCYKTMGLVIKVM